VRIARFAEAAKLELIQDVEFYENKEAGLGARFLASIREVVSRAILYPLTGSLYRKNTCRLLVKDFPFAVIYRSHADGVLAITNRQQLIELFRAI
jgi:hypothetical protein